MTSVSSLGSTLTQYQSPLSSLDKNGDGIISPDELLAAGQTPTTASSTSSTSSTATTTDDDGDDSTDVVKKITADILSLMLSLQKTDDSDGDNTDDSQSDGSQGVLSSLDKNGDGKLTEAEILDADPQTLAADGSGDSDALLTNVLQQLQAAQQAYQNTYGSSAAANDVPADDVEGI